MTQSRRGFIRIAAGAGAGALALGLTEPLAGRATARPPARALRLLVLGGTGFIGPHQVRYALERGHEVTVFNRGRRDAVAGVEELIGDRAVNDYASLAGRKWDAVIDNSASAATAPQWVREAAGVLRDATDQYLFISTRSVYRDLSRVPATIDAPVFTPGTTEGWEEGKPYPYGLAKALAEAETRNAFGARATIVRPGLIVGPGDETDRFTYWPVRIARGGEVLAPGTGADRVQIIDVRDLCEWCIRLVEQRTYGTYMAVGPANGRSMAELLYGIAATTSVPLSWTWAPAEFLAQHRIRPYAEMPVWMPDTPENAGFARFDLTREIAAGLTFRSLAATATATLEYHLSRPAERQAKLRAGITAEREAEVLAAWRNAARGTGA